MYLEIGIENLDGFQRFECVPQGPCRRSFAERKTVEKLAQFHIFGDEQARVEASIDERHSSHFGHRLL